jgi:hypothetical protein
MIGPVYDACALPVINFMCDASVRNSEPGPRSIESGKEIHQGVCAVVNNQ